MTSPERLERMYVLIQELDSLTDTDHTLAAAVSWGTRS
jgi:hypothetical protein